MNDNVDAIIVGAGPAGLAAAAELAKHQLSVCLLDEQIGPGFGVIPTLHTCGRE
jgi:flavin-dependent dehydrogenase